MHVAEHRVGRGHSPGRRIGEHDDVGQAGFLEFGQRDGRPRQLHQAEDRLLHPSAAGCGADDVGTLIGDCCADSGNECCADGDTHRTAHEGEVLDPEDDLVTIDSATGVDQRVALTGLGPSILQLLAVALFRLEPQWILADFGRGGALIFAGIEQLLEALCRADAVVEVAARTDAVILLPLLGEHHRPALGALVPQVFGGLALGQERDPAAHSAQPAHGCNSLLGRAD